MMIDKIFEIASLLISSRHSANNIIKRANITEYYSREARVKPGRRLFCELINRLMTASSHVINVINLSSLKTKSNMVIGQASSIGYDHTNEQPAGKINDGRSILNSKY